MSDRYHSSTDRLKGENSLTGLWVTTPTPYTREGEIDLEMVERNVRYLTENGVRRIVPAGNTGEYFALLPTEVVELVAATRRATAEAVVLAGVGGSLAACLRLIEQVIAAGADGIMLHEPIHTHIGMAGLDEYFDAVCEAAAGRVMLYKRQRTPDTLLARLMRDDVILGVKYAVNDLIAFQRCKDEIEGIWICGTSELWAPFFYLLGAAGFTSGLANAAPALPVLMESALAAGNVDRAMELRQLARPFEELRSEENAAKSTPAVRAIMELAGFSIGPARPPLARLTSTDQTRVEEIWERWQEAGVVTRVGDADPTRE